MTCSSPRWGNGIMVSERDSGSFFFRGGGLRWWENLERQTDGQGNILVPPSSRSQTLGLELLPSVQPVMLVGSLRDNPIQELENGLAVAAASPFNNSENPVFVNVVNQPGVSIVSDTPVDVSLTGTPGVRVANTSPLSVEETRPPAQMRPDGGVIVRLSGEQNGTNLGPSNIVLPDLWEGYHDVFELLSFTLIWVNASSTGKFGRVEYRSRAGSGGPVVSTLVWQPPHDSYDGEARYIHALFQPGLPLHAATTQGSLNAFWYTKQSGTTTLSYAALLRFWRDDEDDDDYPYDGRFETLTVNPSAP